SDTQRHLHSFPTRRSSDLNTTNSAGASYSDELSDKVTVYGKYTFTNRKNYTSGNSVLQSPFETYTIVNQEEKEVTSDSYNHLMRSEEHTSELQSRENLVCR